MEERYEYLLEQYFCKRITPEERAEMDDLVAKDPAFAEAFSFQKKVAAAVISKERARLKARLVEIEKNRTDNGNSWSIWTKVLWATAAAIALIAAAFFAMPSQTPSGNATDGQKSMVQNVSFTSYPNEYASAGSTENLPAGLQQASDAYQKGQYAEAARLFAAITPPDPAYPFYQGIALVGAKRYDEARTVLQPLAQGNNPNYSAVAQYYTALAYYLAGNKEQAKEAAKAYLASPEKTSETEMRKMAKEMAK